MKLRQNFLNQFDCVLIIDGVEYLDEQLTINYHISLNKKYFYKITSTNDFVQDFFSSKYIEGVKGFGQHIILNNKYYLVYKEKTSKLEVITQDNSLFINGIIINQD